MIVLSTKDQEHQRALVEAPGQELAAAVAIPKITPYAQTAVQADFGADSKSKELEAEYTGPNYLGQLGQVVSFQLAVCTAIAGGAWLVGLVL